MATDRTNPPRAAELVPYGLLYPAEEARKASKLVQDEIAGHRNQLDSLRRFAAENTSLIGLVRRLPDELSHEIMVPFGKAAFFPGRLVHTNEFLVLLGEGYYADKTAKQTVEVLRRRGEVLESKVEALDVMISDLQARAKFYHETADESGEGMVEIREYEEFQSDPKESSGAPRSASKVSSEDGTEKMAITDEEYANMLTGLDELEKAELAAESLLHDSDDEDVETKANTSNLKEVNNRKDHNYLEVKNEEQISNYDGRLQEAAVHPSKIFSEKFHRPSLALGDNKIAAVGEKTTASEFVVKDDSVFESSHSTLKSSLSAHEENLHEKRLRKDKSPTENFSTKACTTEHGHRKAFTGSIIEHTTELTHDLSIQKSSQGATSSSKPVSRFKLQKGR